MCWHPWSEVCAIIACYYFELHQSKRRFDWNWFNYAVFGILNYVEHIDTDWAAIIIYMYRNMYQHSILVDSIISQEARIIIWITIHLPLVVLLNMHTPDQYWNIKRWLSKYARQRVGVAGSRFGRSGNPRVVGSHPDLAISNPGWVKPMTLKFIPVIP